MAVKTIAGLAPTLMAVGLVSENLRVVKKKKKTVGDITGLGIKNIIGTSLIKSTSGLVSEL